jgi:serine/threonine protein kinase
MENNMMENIGQQLGRYHLLKLLGKGNTTTVYLAEALDNTTPVAIKVLRRDALKSEQDTFVHAARVMAHLNHPHIIRLYDFGEQDHALYLVVDYAPNGSVRQRYPRESRVPLETITTYVKQIAQALSYAHTQHVAHQHIKPENILLGTNEVILLSDFGFPSHQYFPFSSETGAPPSSVIYMAPEQLSGKPLEASDQYALGIIVYEWFNGSPPFMGSTKEIVVQQIDSPPLSLCKQIPDLSPRVDQVIMTALAKNPQERFPDILSFATTLEQASLD